MNVAKEKSRVPWECVTGGGVGTQGWMVLVASENMDGPCMTLAMSHQLCWPSGH